MTTAERVKELRKSKGWTLQQLADKCGVTKQSVHLWESGTQGISRQSPEILCDIFNVQMDYLLCKQDTSADLLTAEEQQIIDAYRELSYEQQLLVCSMLNVEKDEEPADFDIDLPREEKKMYNERKLNAVKKYQSKFKRFSVYIPKEMDEVVKRAAGDMSRQQYFWSLINKDLKEKGLIE